MNERFINLEAAREPDQLEVMQQIDDDGVCPFCVESLAKYHKHPIVRESDNWLVTESQWPYKYTQRHLLLISREHVESPLDLPNEAFAEMGDHMKWAISYEEVAYGGLAMRFGDASKTGASVKHLHAHIVQASEELSEDEKLRFKFSR